MGRVAGTDPDTGLHRTQGNYARVADLAEAGGASGDVSRAVPADTRAVVDTMPTDFKQWEEMNKNLARLSTTQHRTQFELARDAGVRRRDQGCAQGSVGGAQRVRRRSRQDLAATSDPADIYRALQNLLAQADEAGDTDTVRRIQAFLEAQDQKMYETMADLANQVDEFEAMSAQRPR